LLLVVVVVAVVVVVVIVVGGLVFLAQLSELTVGSAIHNLYFMFLFTQMIVTLALHYTVVVKNLCVVVFVAVVCLCSVFCLAGCCVVVVIVALALVYTGPSLEANCTVHCVGTCHKCDSVLREFPAQLHIAAKLQ
jgi:hypothetical protein